ncbi:hypothetical protein MHPYR_350073 [uncultured Mycobacterium sp.]|uniref:Uncharacterized protein n=1 Tax=uncultured Mycobacterium sp. TaxID=171292 RepID=A0A1Y5PKL9_9MYCO|nr:hypothetical protein MHPYR_350073 [uncultured Mycobacterium sp.]
MSGTCWGGQLLTGSAVGGPSMIVLRQRGEPVVDGQRSCSAPDGRFTGQIQLGNHTWSHPDTTRIGAAALVDQMTRNADFLERPRPSIAVTATDTAGTGIRVDGGLTAVCPRTELRESRAYFGVTTVGRRRASVVKCLRGWLILSRELVVGAARSFADKQDSQSTGRTS